MSPSVPPSLASSQLQSSPAYPDPIPGILHFGSVNILAGASGVGKTCLLSTILTCIRDGAPVFGHPTVTPPKIAYISADRGGTTLRFWLGRAGYANLPTYSLVDDLAFNTTRLRHRFQLVQVLAECIDRLLPPPGSLIVVDPLALFMGGNLNDYTNCAIACLEIRRMCMTKQITLVGTAHAPKQKNDRKEQYTSLFDRILGSGAQLAYCDTQMYLASPEETQEKFYTFAWKSHMAVGEYHALGRNDLGLFVPYHESNRSKEEQKVLSLIPEPPESIGFGELLLLAEVARATTFRYLQGFVKEGIVQKIDHGRYVRPKAS